MRRRTIPTDVRGLEREVAKAVKQVRTFQRRARIATSCIAKWRRRQTDLERRLAAAEQAVADEARRALQEIRAREAVAASPVKVESGSGPALASVKPSPGRARRRISFDRS